MRTLSTLLAAVAVAALALTAPAPALRAEDVPAASYFQVDLSKHVNQSFYEPMLKADGNDLASFAGAATTETPRKTLKGIPFRLDGVVLVGPGASVNGFTGESIPVAKEVKGIPVGRKAQELHFLHSTNWFAPKDTKIAAYVVNYADGSKAEIPIRYGVDVLDWWAVPMDADRGASVTEGLVAWTGTNAATVRSGPELQIRLFLKTWKNPHPDQEIKTLDVVAGEYKGGGMNGAPAPFLVAVSGK
jgi:hypothetical protein